MSDNLVSETLRLSPKLPCFCKVNSLAEKPLVVKEVAVLGYVLHYKKQLCYVYIFT